MTPYADVTEQITIDVAPAGPLYMAHDLQGERLLILLPTSDELIEIPSGWNGTLLPESVPIRHTLSGWPVGDAQALAVDAARGHLYILDGETQTVVEMAPGAGGSLTNASHVSTIALALPTGVSPKGLTHNSATGQFYTLSANGDAAYEFSATGVLQHTYSLAGVGLTNPQALVLAPTADNTDDPTALDLFVVDSTPNSVSTSAGAIPDAVQATERTDQDAPRLFFPLITGAANGNAPVGATSGRIVELFLIPRGWLGLAPRRL